MINYLYYCTSTKNHVHSLKVRRDLSTPAYLVWQCYHCGTFYKHNRVEWHLRLLGMPKDQATNKTDATRIVRAILGYPEGVYSRRVSNAKYDAMFQ